MPLARSQTVSPASPSSDQAHSAEERVWAALLDRHRVGDPTALNELALALYPSIRRIVCRLAGARRRDAHEDLVQSALEQVCRSIDKFERRSRLSSFVFGICHRVVVRSFRYDRVRAWYRRDAERATTGAEPARADDLYEQARGVAHARARLDALSSDERAAFVMFEVEELPLEEVAVALSCSTRTVKRRLRTARHKLLR
ncbi:MAG TPA: RNA polymerase sigma factor [Polyangia bacterium]